MALSELTRYSHSGVGALRGTSSWLVQFARRQPLGFVGLVLITFIFFIAIFGPLLAPKDPLDFFGQPIFHSPQWYKGFVLGTDHIGRDNLSRLMVGARSSISIAVIAVVSGTSIGLLFGLVSGFYGGWLDALIQRIMEVLMAVPTLVLAIAIVAVLGASQQNVIIAIALIQIPGTARIVRSVVLSVRTMEFISASRAIGASDLRILFRHVAPQTFAPVMILFTSFLGLAIIIEASLSFLGLGTPEPNPAWGQMLSGKTLENVERAPWNAVFPGLALTITVFGFNLLGDGLRDVLDPRLRR